MRFAPRAPSRVASLSLAVALAACGADAEAGADTSAETAGADVSAVDPLQLPNPFEVSDSTWGQASAGRDFGAVSAIYPAPDGRSIWVGERCGANVCVDSDVVGTGSEDVEMPPPGGAVFYYLVRAENGCGASIAARDCP